MLPFRVLGLERQGLLDAQRIPQNQMRIGRNVVEERSQMLVVCRQERVRNQSTGSTVELVDDLPGPERRHVHVVAQCSNGPFRSSDCIGLIRDFPRRAELDVLDFIARLLVIRVEASNPLDPLIVELDAEGAVAIARREDINDRAAKGEGPHVFDQRNAEVAELQQPGDKHFPVELLSKSDAELSHLHAISRWDPSRKGDCGHEQDRPASLEQASQGCHAQHLRTAIRHDLEQRARVRRREDRHGFRL